MSGSESEIESPKITSTQLSPKKLNFPKEFRGMNMKNLIKSKAMTLTKKNDEKATSEITPISPLIKHKFMDDERDSSYYSSNDSQRKNAVSSTSSDDADSECGSGSDTDNRSTSKKHKSFKGNGSNSVKKQSKSEESSEDSGSSSGGASSEEGKCKQQDSCKESDSESSSDESSSGESNSDSESNADQTSKTCKGTQMKTRQEQEMSKESESSSDESSSGESNSDSESTVDQTVKICKDTQVKTRQEQEMSKESDSDSSTAESNSDSESDADQPMSNHYSTYKATNETVKVLENYVEMHNLQPVPLDNAFDLGDLSDSDEFFVINIAKDINPACLMNSELTFEKRQILQLPQSKDKLNLAFDEDDKNKLCVLGKLHDKYGIRHFQTSGSIIITKSDNVDNVDLKPKTVMAKEKVPFPVDKLRLRHPLFGRNYESKITLDETVSKKLDSLIENLLVKYVEEGCTDIYKVDVSKDNKKFKKKKGDNSKNNLETDEKSEKRKKKNDYIASILSSFGDAANKKAKETVPKKDKKEKNKSEFPQKEVMPQNKKQTSLSPIKEVKDNRSSPTQTLKKKSRKVCEEDSADDFVNPPPTQAINKKVSKLMSSTMNSASIQKAVFDLDESVIPIPEKKTHRKKDKSNAPVIKDEIVTEPVSTSPKKKERKDKKTEGAMKSVIAGAKKKIELDRTLMNLIAETLKPTQESLPEKKEEKKRKRRYSIILTEETEAKAEKKEKTRIKKQRLTMV